MTWLAAFSVLLMPVCATLGGVATWALARGRETDDGALLRHFVVSTMLFLLVFAAVPRTDWFRNRYDPVTKRANAATAHPPSAALREHKPWDWKELQAQATAQAASGVAPEQVLAYVRMQQLYLVRKYLPWAPGTTVVRYGVALLAAMKELQPANPRLCVRLAWTRSGLAPDAIPALSATAARDYEEAVAEVFRRADQAYGASERFAKEHPDNAYAPMDQVQLAYRQIATGLQERHGAVAGLLQSERVSQLDPGAACAASIDLLTRVLQQEPKLAHPMARNLLRS